MNIGLKLLLLMSVKCSSGAGEMAQRLGVLAIL